MKGLKLVGVSSYAYFCRNGFQRYEFQRNGQVVVIHAKSDDDAAKQAREAFRASTAIAAARGGGR